MPLIGNHLAALLENRGISYEVIHHRPDYTALRTAADTKTDAHQFAKSVLIVVDGRYTLAVVPADRTVDLVKIGRVFDAREVELADEDDLADACPDCEVGAEPPLGNLYGLPVLLDAELCAGRLITFNAGTHEDAVRMKLVDFLKVARPRVMDLAT